MMNSGSRTDKGITRDHNEDACAVMDDIRTYVVADGVGGSRAGELASKTAVEDAAVFLRENAPDQISDQAELGRVLKGCVDLINEHVYRLGHESSENSGMATTLVLCCLDDKNAWFVNVGDSRAYIWRGGEIFQITEDHSYVNALVRMGVITREEAEVHEKGNVITKAMGAEKTVEADYYKTAVEAGDVILLCTDGLYKELKEKEISDCIAAYDDMEQVCRVLVDRANRAGGRDNITALCVKISEGGDRNE